MDPKLDEVEKAIISLESLSEDQIRDYIDLLSQEERRLSRKRKQLHTVIDQTRSEILKRLQKSRRKARKEIYEETIKNLLNPIAGITEETPEELSDDEINRDIESMSFEELESFYNILRKEEGRVSFRRRIIQGKIDILRNALSLREATAPTDEEFARQLAKLLSEKGF